MNNWNDFEPEDEYKKWSQWTMKSKKSSSLPNFVSAFVFGLAAIVVMAGNII
ncbi:MAG: hypothetical protein QNK87_02790 [Octadecabacter sp.]|jgi:hypothetical protein|nr:hypothetical protein [Octadecabacter sp.]MDC1380151.1 hypothetical protein [Octadecabacter sp.]MDC1397832.1 hypothetical protein [Octadecabacter sp.]|tara:strand:- start:47 stop:202 length:156 start_codon:yes stop_codon:yes gene_type:complete